MKWMFRLLLLLATAWSGYWYFGAKAQEKVYASLLQEGREAGWVAESRNLGVQGFPNRFDTTLTGIDFRDPSGRWGWQGEEFNIKALSYKLNHVIVDWPGEQVFSTPEGQITVNAELLRASIVATAEASLPLERLQLEGLNMALNISRLGDAQIASLNAALFQDETNDSLYRFGLDMGDISPPSSLTSIMGGGAFLPDLVESLRLNANLEFSRPIDRLALSDGNPPRLISAEITPSVIIWGSSQLKVTGDIRRSDSGRMAGSLSFEVQNWQALYEVFKQSSNLTTTEKLSLQRALDAASSGDTLAFTLAFTDGDSNIGPFTIGPAPRWPF